jgi:hypothetical protein
MEDINTIDSMFNTNAASVEKTAAQLADFIVREESQIEAIDSVLKNRKENLEQCKTQLAQLLIQAGIESIRLEGGLAPRAKIVRKYFKQAGVSDEMLFEWLSRNDLDGIIKPYVHFTTLQAALKDFEEQGNILPDELFNTLDTPTITMFGKSKYLQKTEPSTEI